MEELCQEVLRTILNFCKPRRVILYGEKVTAVEHHIKSLDLCIVLDSLHEMNRSQLLAKLYLANAAPIPVQFTVYLTTDWKRLRKIPESHAARIEQKGTVLYEQNPT